MTIRSKRAVKRDETDRGEASMNQSTPPTTWLVLYPFFFAGMWCLVCWLISRIGGWSRLAARFPAKDRPSGTRFGMQAGRVGHAKYGGCLTLHTSADGLYLSVWPLFRIGHPPLFIPWNAIRNASIRRFLWTERVVFEVRAGDGIIMQLPRNVFADRPAEFWNAER